MRDSRTGPASGATDTAPGGGDAEGARGAEMTRPAVRASVWTMGGYATSQALRFGGNLVLTRLLFPAVFGQMALVFIFIQGLQMFSDVGTGPAIVQNSRGDEPTFLNTAWTIQVVRGALLWIFSCLIAWPVSSLYGEASLRWLLPAAGLTALIAGLESTAVHQVQRHLRLERLTILDVTAQAVGLAVTVLLAFWHRAAFGPNDPTAVWAIIGGTLVSSLTRLALSHTYLEGVRNRLCLDRESARRLFTFGRWIFVSTLLTFLAGQSDRLIFGKMIPMEILGVYSIALMLATLPTQAVLKLGTSVVFPAYSRLASRDDFKVLFWRVRLPLLVGGAALVTGLVAAGPFLVGLIYDPRYAQAGWILQFLAAAAWFQILEVTNGAALLAKGHARWIAAGSAAKVTGMVLLIPVGFHVDAFRGALVGMVAAEALKYATVALGAGLAGLPGFGRDLLLTFGVAATSALGVLAARGLVDAGSGYLPGLLVAGLFASSPWIPFALRLGLGEWRHARGGRHDVARQGPLASR